MTNAWITACPTPLGHYRVLLTAVRGVAWSVA